MFIAFMWAYTVDTTPQIFFRDDCIQTQEQREWDIRCLLLLCGFSTLDLLGPTELRTTRSVPTQDSRNKDCRPSSLCSCALSVVYAKLYLPWWRDQTMVKNNTISCQKTAAIEQVDSLGPACISAQIFFETPHHHKSMQNLCSFLHQTVFGSQT